jgi:hypothetical protein
MKIAPLTKHTPHYPTKEQVDLNRMLLRYKPAWWKTSGTALLLLGALAGTGLTGCKPTVVGELQGPETEYRTIVMAPLFEGTLSGRPEAGLLSPSDPQAHTDPYAHTDPQSPSESQTESSTRPLLSDDSAYTIITDELRKQEEKFYFSKSGQRVNFQGDTGSTHWKFDFTFNGGSAHIQAEFLASSSAETLTEWRERKAFELPENSKEAAAILRENLIDAEIEVPVQEEDVVGVVFYADDTAVTQEEHLRAQVAEFVQWLKTNGYI